MFQHVGDVWTDAIVAQQNVTNSGNDDFLHSTFTRAICRPDGSNV
jgi:hypothetical protein